eukprot:TRINITY_DN9594_c0_g1_i1.p1 TRINITY_DN9594_c0_g1~~TRINITY_DN9594_c0_g1_i1.p1  ORF type:complete len:322 (-),score=48.49 TRINITY_DN9594_c0_g1_i1:284-1249(-)
MSFADDHELPEASSDSKIEYDLPPALSGSLEAIGEPEILDVDSSLTGKLRRNSRRLGICGVVLAVIITVAVVIGTFRTQIIDGLSAIQVDKHDPGAATLFILAGLGMFATQFLGLSWWLFPTSYFFGYLTFLFTFLVCTIGISMNFWAGRAIKHCTTNSTFGANSASEIDKIQRHFESKPFKFVILVCFSPVAIGMTITLLGLYTEIKFYVVLSAGVVTMMIQALPIILIAASAASLVEAFDDPVNVVSTIATIVAAVLMFIGLGVYTKRELNRIRALNDVHEALEGPGNTLEMQYSPLTAPATVVDIEADELSLEHSELH